MVPVHAQESSSDTLQSLDRQLARCYREGRYGEALALARRVLRMREEALGADHPEVATSVNNLAELHRLVGDYKEAERLHRRALGLRERVLGPEHPAVAASLSNLAGVYKERGAVRRSLPLLERARGIREASLGPDHPELALSINNLAEVHRALGALRRAEPLYERALGILEGALGEGHLKTAAVRINLAGLHQELGRYASAESLYRQALSVREAVLGREHPVTALTLNNLAGLYVEAASYDRAEALYGEALGVLEGALGPDHPHTAAVIGNLAMLYQALGVFDRAEALHRRALGVRERVLGPDHPDVAVSLNNLAELYRAKGSFHRAGPLYRRALAIREEGLGEEHPGTAVVLNNLAELYRVMGDHEQARPLYERALEIRKGALGPDHPSVARGLNNLGLLLFEEGETERAEGLYREALRIRREALGPDHPDTANSLHNLADLLRVMGDFEGAEALFLEQQAVLERVLGPEHPRVALSLHNRAELYRQMGDYDRAEPLYRQALDLRERVLGRSHPHTAESLEGLGLVYAGRGEFRRAHGAFLEAQGIVSGLVGRVLGHVREDRRLRFLSAQQAGFEAFVGLAAFELDGDAAVRKDALDGVLRRKGLLLEARRRFQEAVLARGDEAALELFHRIGRLRVQRSRRVFEGAGDRGFEAFQREVEGLGREIHRLEDRLARTCAGFAEMQAVQEAESGAVARALPSGSVLVEYLRIHPRRFGAVRDEPRWSAPRYVAFVLPAGESARIDLVDLGEAAAIEEGIAAYRGALGRIERDPASVRRLARGLFEQVFAPVLPLLGGRDSLFVAPDGRLNLIPFEVLRGPDGRYLIETFAVRYLTCGRDVLGGGGGAPGSGPPVLMGDPDFDLGGEEGGAGFSGGWLRGVPFDRLPGSREEVLAVGGILAQDRPRVYLGAEALEKVLLDLKQPGPRILHLATHGFFLGGTGSSGGGERGLGVVGSEGEPPFPPSVSAMEDPLLRSGLALAGANRSLEAGAREGDGILTAEEILGLDLEGTELVVLSACETGVGRVTAGQGVYGLRRAFLGAGARGLVMSLWSVPDRETRELMEAFYRNLVVERMGRARALRQAVLGELDRVRRRYGWADPFYWGGFVFLGRPERGG